MFYEKLFVAVLTLGAVIGTAAVSIAQKESNASLWAPLEFLLGEWVGEGGGDPGQGVGGFSFKWDLDKKIIVRTNFADYPATKERAAFSHHDLTVLYPDSAAGGLRAIYFDNEGHIIHYRIPQSSDPDLVQFVSDPTPSAARYRLTYKKTGGAAVSIKFEIAPPGKPDSFATYIEARARRK